MRMATIKRFKNYSKSIKGKSRFNRHPIIFDGWNAQLVSLVSHLIFDGEIKYGGCVYTKRNTVLLKRVAICMKVVYPFPPKKYESFPGVHKIAYHNVELSSYLKAKAQKLLRDIGNTSTQLQQIFLRSFFDDEGSVYFIHKRRAVRGYQHNIKILVIVKTLLKNFGIESRIDAKYNEIIISRRNDLIKFAEEINFTRGVRINGNRSNSIWKQSLEKRVILQRALSSYQ